MKLCLSQCRSIYLYIDNVRARIGLAALWQYRLKAAIYSGTAAVHDVYNWRHCGRHIFMLLTKFN